MKTSFEVRRLRKVGGAVYLSIPPDHMERLKWSTGDTVVLRLADGKLILERVPLEQLARIRAEETAPALSGGNGE